MVTLGFGGTEVFGAELLEVAGVLVPDLAVLPLPSPLVPSPGPPQEANPKTNGRLSNIDNFLSFIIPPFLGRRILRALENCRPICDKTPLTILKGEPLKPTLIILLKVY